VFALKTEFEFITPSSANRNNGEIDFFSFGSSSPIQLQWAIFVPIEYDSFTTTESQGVAVFSSSGQILYDSRIKELLYKDIFTVLGGLLNDETVSHSSNPESWYAISMFPREIAFVPAPVSGQTDIITKSFKQQTDNTLLKTNRRIRVNQSIALQETTNYSGQMLIPDPVSFF